MKRLSTYLQAAKYGAQPDFKNPINNKLVVLPLYETIQVPGIGASSTSLTAFVNDNLGGQYVVAAVVVNFGTTSTSGTLQVEVAGAGVAQGSGTSQLTGTVSLSGTANTPVNGTVIASPTTIVAGSRVNLIFSGTMTGLANCLVSLLLQRVA